MEKLELATRLAEAAIKSRGLSAMSTDAIVAFALKMAGELIEACKPTRVIVTISGGVYQGMVANRRIDFSVLDFDELTDESATDEERQEGERLQRDIKQLLEDPAHYAE